MNRWKEFSEIIKAPYDKVFSTNGWGDFKVDKDGLHHYDRYGEQCINSNYEKELYINNFLSGDITIKSSEIDLFENISLSKKYNILDIKLKECSSCPFYEDEFNYYNKCYCKSCKSLFHKE